MVVDVVLVAAGVVYAAAVVAVAFVVDVAVCFRWLLPVVCCVRFRFLLLDV